MAVERRLAAILAVDVVGYTRLIREDESGTLTRLREVWDQVLTPEVEARRGRVFKRMGDGALAEFASVVDAVEAAVGIQKAMVTAGSGEGPRIELRIGVNLGDIVIDGDDILGDGVNVAARLEAEAPPGGVLTSDVAHSEVRGKVAVTFVDAGEVSLKNIDRPLRVWRWHSTWTLDAAPRAAAIEATRERLSVAVLPFDNMSSDPDQNFLADGLTEDLITALSRIRWFLVIARNTTFTYKGRAVDVKEVGRDLGVAYVVEGSVRRAGNRIRVTVQLIDARTGAHIWAERYDRELDDIFELQDEITATVAGRIEPELSAVERARGASLRHTDSLGAWECFQRGLHLVWEYSEQNLEDGKKLLRRAIEIDPNFSTAWGYLAYAHYEGVVMGWGDDHVGELQKGLEAGRRATYCDDSDPVAWFGLGRVHMMLGNHAESIDALERAIALNPSYSQARHGLGMILTLAGRLDEARESLRRVERLSPRDPILWATTVVHALVDILAVETDSALHFARRTLQNPRSKGYWPHAVMAAALVQAGDLQAARNHIDQARAALPVLSLRYLREALPTAEPGGLDPYLDALGAAGLPEEAPLS